MEDVNDVDINQADSRQLPDLEKVTKVGDLHLLNMALAGIGISAAAAIALALAIIGIAALVLRDNETASAAPALVSESAAAPGSHASPNGVRRAA